MRASLIVTTYNRPDALHLVLQSVLQQTVPPAEIIVADDGSGADTVETVGRFAKTSPIPGRKTKASARHNRATAHWRRRKGRTSCSSTGTWCCIPSLSPTT